MRGLSIGTPKPLERLSEAERARKGIVCKVTTHILKYLTQEFTRRGFEWFLPVILSRATDPLWPDPDNSIEKRVEAEIYGERVFVTQSMIVHKMVACSLLRPRIFILSPNVRVEKADRARSGIHAYEFTQFDFEIRGATSGEVRALVEEVLRGMVSSLRAEMPKPVGLWRHSWPKIPEEPFEVLDWAKCGESLADLEAPAWVVNIPREFYDFKDGNGRWDNFDLILPGFGEVASGSKREWRYREIVEKMRVSGIDMKNYGALLSLAKEGKIKPSAGAGIGIERLVSWVVGARHIGEVQPFPKIPGIVYDL